MPIPALTAAADDHRALRGAPLTLYLWLIFKHLDVRIMRPVPIKDLAESLHMDRATIRTALNLLVKRGYVERQLMRQRGRHQYEYRLIFQKN